MPVFYKRLTDRVLVTVCLLVGLGSGGCRWLTDGGLRELSRLPSDPARQTDPVSETAQPNPVTPTAGSSGVRAVVARGDDGLGHSVWIHAVRSSREDSPQPGYRWRYPSLEELLARPPERRPNWHRYLADKDPIVAANAAIAMARSGDAGGAERLAETVRDPEINRPMRCAAAEALAGLKVPSVVPLLRGLLDQYGRCTPEPGSTYHADLHAELISGLARNVDPADDPRFVAALRSRASNVRLEAVRAWAGGRRGTLPIEVADLRTDRDRNVRAAVIRALAKLRHPKAHSYLTAALRDHDLQVRTAAVAALGELGGTKARATLEGLLQNQPETIRAGAISALDALGARQAVLEAAGDESWRVRVEVAQALAGYAGREGAAAAGQLLEDPSAEVQRQVVLALAEWPLEQAGPILLEAIGSRSLLTRETAAEQLAARWPPAAEFSIEGPLPRRTDVLEKLQRRFRQEFSLVDQAALAEAVSGGRPASVITPRQLDQVDQLVRQQDVQALVDFGPGLIEVLEQLAFDRQRVLPNVIYRHVLPRYGPVFVALDRLVSSDVSQRRRAANELAALADQRPLGRLAVARLAQLVTAEPDQLVWGSVLTAVADDPSEPSIRLAYAATSHPLPEVRRRACDHLAAHPHPEHAKVLVPALEDRNHTVVCAAARALGAAGRLDDTRPLRRLLGTTDEQLRLETAIALARLGDPAGTAAIQRLSYSANPKVRCQVAVAIGDMADATLVPTLIRLLDDRVAVRRAALESLPKAVGHDVSQSDDQSPASTPERTRRWKRWYEGRHEAAAAGRAMVEHE